jgi:hypothetical protein
VDEEAELGGPPPIEAGIADGFGALAAVGGKGFRR